MNTKLIKRKIANIITAFFNQLNLKNIILMESWPTYSDNSKYVFDEMIRQGVNQNYKIIWNVFSHDTTAIDNYDAIREELTENKNVKVLNAYCGNSVKKLLTRIYKLKPPIIITIIFKNNTFIILIIKRAFKVNYFKL